MKKLVTLMLLLLTCAVAEANPIVLIGDSRFVGMSMAVDTEDVCWVCESGVGAAYYDTVRDDIARLPRTATVVYNLGVNGLDVYGNLANLADLVSLGFADVVFATVTPVDDENAAAYGYDVTDADVRAYNAAVLAKLPPGVRVIDAHTALWAEGFNASDGLHYDAATSQFLFNLLTRR